jgi:hypothetical protein
MFTVKQIINNATSLYEAKKSRLLVLGLSNGVRLLLLLMNWRLWRLTSLNIFRCPMRTKI